MPILDPKTQFSLCENETSVSKSRQFIIKQLETASINCFNNFTTYEASIQFKNDLKDGLSIFQKEYKCDCTIEIDSNDFFINNYFQYILDHVKPAKKVRKFGNNDGKYLVYSNYNDYEHNFNAYFFIPDQILSNFRLWIFTDSPIAILCVKLDNKDFYRDILFIINLEIDIMIAAGFVLSLCVVTTPNSKHTEEFLTKTLKTHKFSEIHFNLLYDERRDIKLYINIIKKIVIISDNIIGYFYIYAPYFQEHSSECVELIKILKKKPRFKIFSFSENLKLALEKYQNNANSLFQLLDDKPFSCQYDQEKIKVMLSNVPLYNTDNEEIDLIPFKSSGIGVGYISKDDFLNWKQTRVPILFDDYSNKHHFVDKFINFDDIHLINIDFYVKNQLYLSQINLQSLETVNKIKQILSEKSYIRQNEFKKESIFSLLKNKQIYKGMIYVSFAFKCFSFDLHINQMYTALEACKICLLNDKSSDSKGVIYQVETGEGKSSIIQIIASILALSKRTVHIATSNIKLSNRDYYESFDFFNKLGLESAVLLHYNELPYINFQNLPNDNTDYKREKYPSKFFDEILFKNPSNMNFSVCGISNENELKKNKANIVFSTFVNFETLYLRIMEMCPRYIKKMFNKSSLLIDEADSILIDEITNGTILSRPMKTNGNDILKYVYSSKIQNKCNEEIYKNVKKNWPKCTDIRIEDIEQMCKEIEIVNNGEFVNGKKYSIEDVSIINDKSKDPLKCKQIIPFDYEHKGILEPNKEFSGFIQQFIAIKEMNNHENMMIKDISMNYLYISHPIFTKLYDSVVGLTGTVGNKNDKKIIKEQYNFTVKKIPRNNPNHLIQLPMILCSDLNERNEKIVLEIIGFHKKGIPVIAVFSNLNEFNDVLERLHNKGIKYINIFDGKDEKIRPDQIAGLSSSISLGTNFCGRGIDIKVSKKPLHVIISYFTSNERVMHQIYGRTARQGNEGSVRIICLKSQFLSPTYIYDNTDMRNYLDDFSFINSLQAVFIDSFRLKREWIFDHNIKSQKLNNEQIQKLRKARININRVTACNYEYPICMSIQTFLNIQAQKVFSLFNCPNSKFTWMLFQQYIREMILETWSLFVNESRKKYNEMKMISYHEFLQSEIHSLRGILKMYLPDSEDMTNDDYQILPTFMHIFNLVSSMYDVKIYKHFPSSMFNIMNSYKNIGSDRYCSISIGFKPYCLINNSGARINTLDNSNQEQNYIIDPELKYMRKQPKGFKPILMSITEKIDGVFNKICEKINNIIGNYTGLKFFLRRTLGGCEFGVCFDFELHETDKSLLIDPNCLVDKDPLLVFTISVKSFIPILAGILIIGLVYIASISKSIAEWITTFGVKFGLDLIKKTVKTVIQKLISQMFQNEIERFCQKICQFLTSILLKQINDLNKFQPDMAVLFKSLLKIVIVKDFTNSSEEIYKIFNSKSFFKININFDFIADGIPMAKFFKIGFLIMLCFASFMINFNFQRKKLKYDTKKVAIEYDQKQDIDLAVKNKEKFVENEESIKILNNSE